MNFKRLFERPVRAYWWTDVANFGDALAPLLLARFADIEVQHAAAGHAEIVSVGSVLEHIPRGWAGYIVGSGKLRPEAPLKFDPHQAKILALRGPLTASNMGDIFGLNWNRANFALGDPGLLANELLSEMPEKQWDLGIVPHWQDNQLARRFLKLIPEQFSVRIISPGLAPLQVISEIASCRRVVTSSLHGMIVADALGGIPRRVEICDKMARDGGLFKFRDYSESIKCPLEIGKMQEPQRNRVEDARFEIWDAYRELSRIYGKS